MIPVYLTTLDPMAWKPHLRPTRTKMFELTRARWLQEPQARVVTWLPEALGCPVGAFQRERRVTAEVTAEAAQEAFYVVADDDCLPVGVARPGQAPVGPAPFLEEAVGILKAHPEFAILSTWPVNARIRPWRPGGGYEPIEDTEVMEHHDVGQIRVCRTGCMKAWPEQTRTGYDREHCVALREAGWRVGYYRNIRHLHLGEGYSTVW